MVLKKLRPWNCHSNKPRKLKYECPIFKLKCEYFFMGPEMGLKIKLLVEILDPLIDLCQISNMHPLRLTKMTVLKKKWNFSY